MNLTKQLTTLVPRFNAADLFDPADEVECREIERLFVEQTFGFHETIFKQGSRPAGIWKIVRGTGVLSRCNANGEPSFARIIYPGEILGLTETLARIPFDATLQSFLSCTCQRMGHRELVTVLKRQPRLRQRIIDVLARNYLKALATADSTPLRVTSITYRECGWN